VASHTSGKRALSKGEVERPLFKAALAQGIIVKRLTPIFSQVPIRDVEE